MTLNMSVYLRGLLAWLLLQPTLAKYLVGSGIADCTGPSGEIVFMGYAKTHQKGCGIHLRQYSRAFIVDDGTSTVAIVIVDTGMISHGVKLEVLNHLKKLYNNTYTEKNLLLSGTHTHGAPGGYMMDFMYDLPSYGFVEETFAALVRGITKSIVRAHGNMIEGAIYVSSGQLQGININRSPSAYLQNPIEERRNYEYNVDKEMVQILLVRLSDNLPIGAISSFPIHPTSMNSTNCLITSDNVGYAAVLLEKSRNKPTSLSKRTFVGAFAVANLGDVSPNTKGPRCINTGEECDVHTSTCNGEAKYCRASGPGSNMFESTKIIAEQLFNKAKMLLDNPTKNQMTGPVKYIHQYVDMPAQKVSLMLPNGTAVMVSGCRPAMGYSFAAGTTDGVGEMNFRQGTGDSSPLWDMIRDFIFKPTLEDIKCHHPKPILINTGGISFPYQWQPSIVSTQLIQLGESVLIAVPGEFTTMSGRRLRNAVEKAFNNVLESNKQMTTIIVGLSNTYTSYVATPEEYQVQRYEGASTIFGPHTLTIYLDVYLKLALAMATNQYLPQGPQPSNLLHQSSLMSFNPPVIFDTSGLLHSFGDVLTQPPPKVRRGTTVSAVFVAAHPRNNLMHEDTFLAIEKLEKEQNWTIIATDGDWDTKFIWGKTTRLSGGSTAKILWDIPEETKPGKYRIKHFGHYKSILGEIVPYIGTTTFFEVE